MKKVSLLLLATGLFAFVACNQGTQEAEDVSADEGDAVEAVVEETEVPAEEAVTEEAEQLVDHVCNDLCTEDACHFKHGEKGHVCTDACHAESEEGEEHEGHDHAEEGTSEG